MIENLLTKAIRDYIAEAVKDFRLPVKNGEMRQPEIINGYLPPKRSGVNDDFPFVVVYPASGNIELEVTDTTVEIVIGCYSDEFDGYEYCMNVFSRIRNALTMLPDSTLENKYTLQYPLKWENIEDQPYPQWQMRLETIWQTITPTPEYTGGR